MFKTKKDLDQHVRSSLAKLRSEYEKNMRGFTIAKLYFKISEYSTAEQYVSQYLTVKEDNDQAHKLLGQCYLQQKKTNKALEAFQRSLQLNPKQPELLGDVCQLLIDDKELNTNKAKYWCDLAESKNVNHDAVFSLRLKLMNKDNLDTNQVEQMIEKQISLHSNDVNLRISLVRCLAKQNKTLEAFQNIYQLEMANHQMLAQSAEWYNVVWLVLTKYEQISNAKKDWQFWLLVITCLERQVYLSFISNETAILSTNGGGSGGGVSGITETANLLFRFDQYLFKVSQLVNSINQQRELVVRFMEHYQGQLCLYAAALIFKRELIQKKYKWKETIKTCLPLLLMAYHSSKPNSKEQWMKHCDEHGSQLLQQWQKEGAFRCFQAGRTLFACFEENNENNSNQSNLIGYSSMPWTTSDALINQIRQICTDKDWRRGIFSQLFCNSDQKIKENTSHFMKSSQLSEPIYELPTYAELEEHSETAQYLMPQSLEHMAYLCLGNDNLAHVRANFFSGLNFSTNNLAFCGVESLNQLDIETFLYATTLQLESLLKVERLNHDSYHNHHQGSSIVPKPKVLPFVNMRHQICYDEQANWWLAAYQVYKNLANENLAQIRATLQYGIEVVRAINGPKIDMLIVFKLGKIFEERAADANTPAQKGMLKARAENLYKHGLNMLKMKNKGVLEPFKRYFKNTSGDSASQEREITILAEDAANFVAVKYCENSEYEDLIEEFNGIDLPFAAYHLSEAYRKLDKLSKKTPKRNKHFYMAKANECLNRTQELLKSPHVDPNHPLNSVVSFELKNLQQITNNSSSYEDAENEFGIVDSPQQFNNNYTPVRSRIDNSVLEMKNMIKQIDNKMTDMKKEIESIHSQLHEIKDTIAKKSSQPPSRDEDASNALDDLYIIEDELQNQLYSNQQQQQTFNNNMYGSNYSQSSHSMGGQRLHTPTAVGAAGPGGVGVASGGMVNVPGSGGMPSYNNALYGNYAMNYYAQQLMMPPQPQLPAAPPVMGINHNQSQIPNRNPLGLPYMDSQMNFNISGINPSLLMQPTSQDSRSSNLCGLLNQNSQQQPPLLAPVQQQPPLLGPPMQQQQQPQPSLGYPLQQLHQQQQQPPMSIQSMITTPALTMPSINMPTKMPTIPPLIAPPPPATSVSIPPSAVLPMTFNKSINNAPVEKGPPVNVVITSSDPLPTTSVTMQPQPALCVTIPSHHIKPSLISTKTTTANTNFPMIGVTSTPVTSPFTMKFSSSTLTTTAAATATSTTTTSSTVNPMTFSFRPPSPKSLENLNKTNDSNTSAADLHKSEHEVEYDPRPDFQPIIPLPDEIEVKTGEENEEVMFSARSKLFRFADKEWKERGVGDIKILKNNDNGTSRILMRRDQTHKICANHRITNELNLTKPKSSSKGFIWAANDFADEELKLEKFLVRFKDIEIEKQFEAAFNVARNEDIELSSSNAAANNKQNDDNQKPKPQPNLVAFGGLSKTTYSDNKTSTPTIKSTTNKPASSSSNLLIKNNTNPEEIKSPFENFYTPIKNKEPFGNLFANLNNSGNELYYSILNNSDTNVKQETPKPDNTNHNKSDNEDEYVPTAQFQPVIPLPDLVEVTTGEENEIVLFEHRAKLLRFDKTTSEWKERGLGNIKVLQDKNDINNVRLVMRREVIHKLCCNQRLYKDTNFQYTKNSKTSLMWAGQDYSENELQVETLTIRFKTADICKQFLDVIIAAQAKMTSAANEENATAAAVADPPKTTTTEEPTTKGFGDKFKPKAGSWSCDQCYTSNTADKLYCASCEAPKDETVPKKDLFGTTTSIISTATPAASTFKFGFANTNKTATTNATQSFLNTETVESAKQQQSTTVSQTKIPSAATFGFGDQFKPKEGSWSCEQCYTSNTADKLHCASCEAPKDKTVPKKESGLLSLSGDNNAAPKFSFGFGNIGQKAEVKAAAAAPAQQQKETKKSNATATTAAAGFGDQFKPKAGSWSCSECYLSNASDDNYCKACDNPKDSTIPKKEPVNILAPSNPAAKFSFGFKAVDVANTKTETSSSSASSTFSFGGKPVETTANIFGNSNSTNLFSSKLGESKTFSFTPATTTTNTTINDAAATGTIAKSTFSFSLPSKAMEDKNEFSLDKKDFNFVLKPKSPGKAKTALNVSGNTVDDDDNEEGVEEEENNTYFTPAIPLPDKIEVKTGEEDEEVMYSHRAKLYVYTDSEWKERGLGDVKILRHKVTKKLRVVMRRELVLKICLNHILNEDISYKNKDEKSWLFAVNDYSDGEVEMNKLCLLRFKSKDIAAGFMKAVKDCLEGKGTPIEETNATKIDQVQENDVSSSSKEVNISDENKRKADTLLLPYSFFDVSSIVNCPGCRGCDPDKFVFSDPPSSFVSQQNQNDTIPLDINNLSITDSIPRPSIFGTRFDEALKTTAAESVKTTEESKNIFGGFSSTTGAPRFSFTEALNTISKPNGKPSTEFVFGEGNTGSNIFGDKNVFGSNQTNGTTGPSLFGNKSNPLAKSVFPNSLFGGQHLETEQIAKTTDDGTKPSSFQGGTTDGLNSAQVTFGTSSNNSVFGVKPSLFGGGGLNPIAATTIDNSPKTIFGRIEANPSQDSPLSFSDLAKKTPLKPSASDGFIGLPNIDSPSFGDLAKQQQQTTQPDPSARKSLSTGGFFGLTHTNAFSNFKSPQTEADDADNPDPHFEPIIALPDEIALSTGEEDENVIFGERATLFRYDQDKKEWKERGVGELKILQHKTKGTYRMVMRREQIFKLILNHSVGADFSFKPMANSPKAFIWATLNFAEDDQGCVEKLSCRFRNADIAERFNRVLTQCLEIAKS